MNAEEIKEAILGSVIDADVKVQLDGDHASLIVVSQTFEGLSSVKRQQAVYSALTHAISSGGLHAVNMQTFTPQEWEKSAPFQSS